MSYSLAFRARTCAAAALIAAKKIAEVVARDPVHAADRDSVNAAVKGQLANIETGAAGGHVVVSVSASVGWRGVAAGTAAPASEDFAITSANINVSAYVIPEDMEGEHLPALVEAPADAAS